MTRHEPGSLSAQRPFDKLTVSTCSDSKSTMVLAATASATATGAAAVSTEDRTVHLETELRQWLNSHLAPSAGDGASSDASVGDAAGAGAAGAGTAAVASKLQLAAVRKQARIRQQAYHLLKKLSDVLSTVNKVRCAVLCL